MRLNSTRKQKWLGLTAALVCGFLVLVAWGISDAGGRTDHQEQQAAAGTRTPPPPSAQSGSATSSAPGAGSAPSGAGPSSSAPTGAAPADVAATAAPTGTVVTDPPLPPDVDPVRVVVTYAAATSTQVEVSGFVAGVVEGGGRCTATVRDGSRSASATSAAVADATTTACGDMLVAWMPSADATVVISYSSATTEAQSEPTTVEVAP